MCSSPVICHVCWEAGETNPCKHVMDVYQQGVEKGKSLLAGERLSEEAIREKASEHQNRINRIGSLHAAQDYRIGYEQALLDVFGQTVTVCDSCGTEACWNGESMCEKARTAGTESLLGPCDSEKRTIKRASVQGASVTREQVRKVLRQPGDEGESNDR